MVVAASAKVTNDHESVATKSHQHGIRRRQDQGEIATLASEASPGASETATKSEEPGHASSFLNSTSTSRSSNTTSNPNLSSSPTSAIDGTCGEDTPHFAVQVAQPGGTFDGWFLKLSGDAIIFSPSQDLSTQFNVEDSGNLCAVGHVGTQGNAIIAIAENATDVTGGAVYFIDPEVLEDIGELGYAALECEAGGETLACAQGEKRFWVGCGLGLDITSDGDGATVIGGLNCTAVSLAPVYS